MALAVLSPNTDLAPRVLLAGDPGRALALAQALTEKPLMFNHARGLWGYTGLAADGEPLTVQATGIGGPSAAGVVADLAALGARVLVRAGSCMALDPGLADGTLVAAAAALAADGTSRALGADGSVAADAELTSALGVETVTVVSADLWEGGDGRGARVRDLSTATVLQMARTRGLRAAAVLAVGRRPGEESVAALGGAAARALLSAVGACR